MRLETFCNPARERQRMWLIRQTREQQGRGIIGSTEPKGNMGNIGNMNNIGIRANAGNMGKDTMGQMGPRYKIVLLSGMDDEQVMHHYAGKYRSDGQGLKSVDADCKKKRGSGTGSTGRMDGRIRILKREKDLRLKRKVDGRIRILRRDNLN